MPILGWLNKKAKKEGASSIFQASPNEQIGGDIFRYGLVDWWLSEFSQSEREQIADTYRPMGTSGRPLVEGNATRQPELHPGPFLGNLATWVAKPALGDLALRIAEKSASFDTLPSDLTQAHFMFANLCKVYYRFRDTRPDALEKAVWACEQDIALSSKLDPGLGDGVVVAHYCFKQLAIIEEKRGDYDRATSLCREALAQGWSGDWSKRIARIEKTKQRKSR